MIFATYKNNPYEITFGLLITLKEVKICIHTTTKFYIYNPKIMKMHSLLKSYKTHYYIVD